MNLFYCTQSTFTDSFYVLSQGVEFQSSYLSYSVMDDELTRVALSFCSQTPLE
jgi:hypothetical protein